MHRTFRQASAAAVVALTTLALVPTLSGSAVASTLGPASLRVTRTRLTSIVAHVKITAVYYDPYAGPDPDTNAGRNLEYVVLRNSGTRAVRLTGWTIQDLRRTGIPPHVYKFGAFRLRPGKTVRIHTGSGTNTATNRYWGETVYVWGDDSDKATLKNAAGGTVSTCGWGTTDHSPKYC